MSRLNDRHGIIRKPPREIIMTTIEEPRKYPEFQAALDRMSETHLGSSKTPDGRRRVIYEWGGTAFRWFFGNKVPKYRRCHYKEQVAWVFAGNPTARLKHERKPFFTECLDPNEWPDRWHKYLTPTPVFATIAEPYPINYVCIWMSPQKACKDWNDFMYGAPEPTQGYYYPILPIGAEKTEANPFGWRHPDTKDLEVTESILKEMQTDLMSYGKHIDEPLGDSEIDNLNYWIDKGIAATEENEESEFKADVRERILDFLDKNSKHSITSVLDTDIINPKGGKQSRSLTLYMNGTYNEQSKATA